MLIWNNPSLKFLSANDIYEIAHKDIMYLWKKIMNEFVLPAKNVDRQGIETETNEN